MVYRTPDQACTESATLPPEIAFLVGRIGRRELEAASRRALENGTAPQDELLTANVMDAESYTAALAAHLGLGHRAAIKPPTDTNVLGPGPPGAAMRRGLMVAERASQEVTIAAAARGSLASRLLKFANKLPVSGQRVVLVAPQTHIDASLSVIGVDLAVSACNTVNRMMPGLSARDGLARWQRQAMAGLLALSLVGAFFAPRFSLLLLLSGLSIFFLGVSALRLLATAVSVAPKRSTVPAALANSELPIYTVLVPLYREANMVGPLIAALDGLDYPRAKLDIKLIVESDDLATQAALRPLKLPICYEIVTVPHSLPKTKPKALNFALALARGSLVTIYDAEDCPQPNQLRRAAAAFHAAEPEVACLQASLAWYNWTDNWLTRQFAIEYASLFDVLLPTLDRLGLPLPLGGTSNHFRREVLLRVGGWDAWNVTEDADLGIRLMRAGYRCRVLDSTTWEEAPNRIGPWLRQRTRWLKGWMQTYMVHMRRPGGLARALGARGFIAFQLLIGGMVASALLHPLFFLMLGAQVLAGDVFLGADDWLTSALITIGAFNLAAGYSSGFAIGLLALRQRPMRHLAWDLPWVPFYWLLVSVAAYRAVWDLVRRPFYWEKTAHGLSRTVAPLPRLGDVQTLNAGKPVGSRAQV